MNNFLFDILPVINCLENSKQYLNHSYFFHLNKSLSNKQLFKGLEFDNLNILLQRSLEKKIENNSVNYFTLNVLKSINNSDKHQSKEKVIWINSLIKLVINNEVPHNILDFESNNFKYKIPIGIEEVLNIDFGEWETLKSENKYNEWEQIFGESLHLINYLNPDILKTINLLVENILVVNNIGNNHGSMSPLAIRGTIILPNIQDPTLIAECLIHESLHQLLYHIENIKRFFKDDISGMEEIYYSPWKTNPRPLIMVLHGAFVFTGVILFYEKLRKSYKYKHIQQIFSERLSKRFHQVKIAIDVLTQSKRLSDFGLSIIEILKSHLDEITSDLAVVNNEILDHKINYSKGIYHSD